MKKNCAGTVNRKRGAWRLKMSKPIDWIRGIALALFLSATMGCMNVEGIVQALAKDNASACLSAVLWGGVGAMAFTPAPSIPAGGGYGSVTFCRSNQPGSTVEMGPDGSMRIVNGQKP